MAIAGMGAAGGPASVRVRVPASSANLGPGFDALGLALSLYDEATITLRPDSEVVVDIAGMGADSLPRGERHLLLSSLRRAAEHFGGQVDGVEIRVRNAIPQGRGLGSSAATITAGVAAAAMLISGQDSLDRASVLALAAQIEGHPDNVAACVYGGLTISWQGAGGASAVALAVHPNIQPVLYVPDSELSTDLARGLLPASVPHADAAFTAGRSALLIYALTLAPRLLLEATEERLHQSYRAAAMPDTTSLLESLRLAGIAAVVSGAGPSVLALRVTGSATGPTGDVPVPPGWTRHRLAVSVGVQAALAGPLRDRPADRVGE